ncbi:MAG: LuxR C-terminal-related transcriptional regulator [Clostridium sp.]|nr:LuxR C-terminal-related transcriptional regulator [Clostridium sp.]
MKKGIGICLYLVLIAAFLQFDLRLLFDFRQLLLVISGTGLLLLPALHDWHKGWRKKAEEEHGAGLKAFFRRERAWIGQNALWAGILQTFVLLLANMGAVWPDTESTSMQVLALSCRPILYGFLIWVILQDAEDFSGQNETKPEQEAKPEQEKPETNDRERLQALGLTQREVEIALLVIKNKSNAEIAEALFISETTVKKHLSNIFAKLGISKRNEIKELL